jgi:hypothetical protein
VDLLSRARSALLTHDFAAALAATTEHAAAYPRGVLSEEREAIAVEALARAGRTADSHARLRSFVGRFPHSSYRRHLEQLLSAAPP